MILAEGGQVVSSRRSLGDIKQRLAPLSRQKSEKKKSHI